MQLAQHGVNRLHGGVRGLAHLGLGPGVVSVLPLAKRDGQHAHRVLQLGVHVVRLGPGEHGVLRFGQGSGGGWVTWPRQAARVRAGAHPGHTSATIGR
jgi:hypothetical protein